jgi:hypothetical protein
VEAAGVDNAVIARAFYPVLLPVRFPTVRRTFSPCIAFAIRRVPETLGELLAGSLPKQERSLPTLYKEPPLSGPSRYSHLRVHRFSPVLSPMLSMDDGLTLNPRPKPCGIGFYVRSSWFSSPTEAREHPFSRDWRRICVVIYRPQPPRHVEDQDYPGHDMPGPATLELAGRTAQQSLSRESEVRVVVGT